MGPGGRGGAQEFDDPSTGVPRFSEELHAKGKKQTMVIEAEGNRDSMIKQAEGRAGCLAILRRADLHAHLVQGCNDQRPLRRQRPEPPH